MQIDMEKDAETDTTDTEKGRQTDWSLRLSGAEGVQPIYGGREAASASGVRVACRAYLCPQVWGDSFLRILITNPTLPKLC